MAWMHWEYSSLLFHCISGQTQFAEIKTNEVPIRTPSQTACAVIRSNGQEIEINNGADLETLQAILSFVGRL